MWNVERNGKGIREQCLAVKFVVLVSRELPLVALQFFI
jgi:hypothetical protein